MIALTFRPIQAEKKAKAKADEHERWWIGAEMHKEQMSRKTSSDVTICDDDGNQMFPRPKQSHDGKH